MSDPGAPGGVPPAPRRTPAVPQVARAPGSRARLEAEAAAARAARRRMEQEEVESHSMTVLQHLEVLRFRLIRIFVGVLVGFVVLAPFGTDLLRVFMAQAERFFPSGAGFSFVTLQPQEQFMTALKASFYASLLLSGPWSFYQAWAFVGPGLYRRERRAVLPVVVASYGLFITGGVFAYFTVLPFTNGFFLESLLPNVIAQLSIGNYLTYCAITLFSMGAVFQIPLVQGLLARAGVVSVARLRSARRYMVVAIWLVAAVITPPDVLSQSLLAGPMMVLYEVGIQWARVQERRRIRAEAEAEADLMADVEA
ncbi:twin-arginine translocase subunit TatC [Myxococcota bacterium]|nr:twin-arginine translocase subunit TatC [Myxococcota bacterium]